jgi:hypothetical protein
VEDKVSIQERRAIVSVVSTILIAAIYTAVMAPRHPAGDVYSPEVFRFWGAFFLILIPVTIVAKIVITIVFSILNTIATREYDSLLTDERDRLIELKSNWASSYAIGLGFMLAMAALVANLPPTVMFIILYCAGITTELVSDMKQFFFYRRGA